MNICNITGKTNGIAIKICNSCNINKFNRICIHVSFVNLYGSQFILYPIPDKIITKHGQEYGLFSMVSNNHHYRNRFLCLPYECRYYILVQYLQSIHTNIATNKIYQQYITSLNDCIFKKGFSYIKEDIIMLPMDLI